MGKSKQTLMRLRRRGKMIKNMIEGLKQVGYSFKFEPFATTIQPIIQEVLAKYKKK